MRSTAHSRRSGLIALNVARAALSKPHCAAISPFDQASLAKRAGFRAEMRYVALDTFERYLERIKMRADRGGHSAPESLLRAIYESSIGNLPRSIREMDFVFVYDNSRWGQVPQALLQAANGEI